jgi:four helix bundle protein
MVPTTFNELQCWQEATQLAVEIYKLTQERKFQRDFALRDQLRRAAISISSNIAEGKERETVSELIRYLYIAKGSAGELWTQLYIANRVGYVDPTRYKQTCERAEKVAHMIGGMISTVKKGRGQASR